MINDKHQRPGRGEPDHAIELEDYFAGRQIEAPPDEPPPPPPVRRDQYVEYTHEVSEGTAEALSRALIRIVPLIYGGLLGHLGGHIALGLMLGFASTAAFDLYMGDKSLLRAQMRWAAVNLCPRLVASAHGLAGLIQRLGGQAPDFLRRMSCGV